MASFALVQRFLLSPLLQWHLVRWVTAAHSLLLPNPFEKTGKRSADHNQKREAFGKVASLVFFDGCMVNCEADDGPGGIGPAERLGRREAINARAPEVN